MMKSVLFTCLLVATTQAFIPVTNHRQHKHPLEKTIVPSVQPLCMASSTDISSSSPSTTQLSDDENIINDKGLLKRDRYIATNRFSVRTGKEAKFEQRWATRKSRLAELPGFRYFHLMRRVQLADNGDCVYDGGDDKETKQGNYVSFTIWEKKSDFSAWRKGDAFKEAHGGTSIGAFLSTMVNSALVLQGPPRPAFYDGLLVQSTKPKSLPETVDGWRDMASVADGTQTLPTECFVACNQFYVPSENAKAFEQRWAQRESKLKECDGFVAFSMMRRDGQQQGHGTVPIQEGEPTYVSTTIWRDRKSFDQWRNGSAFGEAHGQQSKKPQDGEKKGEVKVNASSPPAPLWSRPPQPVFYEGTLVITKEEGA